MSFLLTFFVRYPLKERSQAKCGSTSFCRKIRGSGSKAQFWTRVCYGRIGAGLRTILSAKERATMRFLRTVLCTDWCLTMPQSVACEKEKMPNKTRLCSSSSLVWRRWQLFIYAPFERRYTPNHFYTPHVFVTTAKERVLHCICGIHVDFYIVRLCTFTSCLLLKKIVLIMLYLIVFVLLRLCIEITLCNVFILERESLKHVFVGITNMMPRYHGLHMSSSRMKAATGQVEIGMEVFLCVEEERLYNAAFLHGPMAIRLWYKRITPLLLTHCGAAYIKSLTLDTQLGTENPCTLREKPCTLTEPQ